VTEVGGWDVGELSCGVWTGHLGVWSREEDGSGGTPLSRYRSGVFMRAVLVWICGRLLGGSNFWTGDSAR
jgi:hypothetical protein